MSEPIELAIWKFEVIMPALDVFDKPIDVKVTKGAKILHAGYDNRGMLCLWALCNTAEKELENRKILIFGTGDKFSPSLLTQFVYLSSVVNSSHIGTFIWHIFVELT